MSHLWAYGAVLSVLIAMVASGLHSVDEGYRGVYWRGGALLDTISHPGYNVKLPFLTRFEQVQVSVQTDRVRKIPCGTSSGVVVEFETIEVVNRLSDKHVLDTVRKYGLDYDKIWIFDKIHHEINQFCSAHSLQEVFVDKFDTLDESLAKVLQQDCDRWNTGIEIIATRVTKPIIPDRIREGYEQAEVERTNLLIRTERHRVVELESETEHQRAKINADADAEVSEIRSEINLLESRAQQRIEAITDESRLHHERTQADAQLYQQQRRAAANKLRFTEAFLENEMWERLAAQPKTYYGTDLPGVMRADAEALARSTGYDAAVVRRILALAAASSSQELEAVATESGAESS